MIGLFPSPSARPCPAISPRSSSSIASSPSKPSPRRSTPKSLPRRLAGHRRSRSHSLLGRHHRRLLSPRRPGRNHSGMERLAQRLDLVASERLRGPAVPSPWNLSRPLLPHSRRRTLPARGHRPAPLRRRRQSPRSAHLSGPRDEARRILRLRRPLDPGGREICCG